MNTNDKLIEFTILLAPVSWYMYLSGQLTLAHTYPQTFLKTGLFLRSFQKSMHPFETYSPSKVLKRCNKSCVLYWVCAVWWMTSFYLKTRRRFRHCFPLPARKRQFGVSKTFTLVTVFENFALRFLFPENAISFRPYVFLLFAGEIYAYRARVDRAMDLLL